MEIKRLYAEEDRWGRKMRTQMQIAKLMGCGETTVYRVIHSAGAYMALPEPATKEEAAESEARFLADHPELSGQDRLAEVTEEAFKSDRMVEELKRGPLDEE